MQNFAGILQTPAQRSQQTDARGDQRHPKQQHGHIAEPDDDSGKQVTLLRDVRLAGPQRMTSQRHVKRIRRADQQVEPDDVPRPTPNQVSDQEDQDHHRDVQREKIRRKRDQKIVFAHDHVAASGSRLEFLHPPAEQPCPERVGQFMTEDVNPHRLWQQEKNHEPAGRARQHRHPHRIGTTAVPQHTDQRPGRADGKRQKQNGDEHFDPFPHAARIQKTPVGSQTKTAEPRNFLS